MIVADVMSAEVVTVEPDLPLKTAATVMLRAGVSGLPVVDVSGKLIGIITEADFLDQEADHAWSRPHRLLDGVFGRGSEAVSQAETVGDVMTTKLTTISGSMPLGGAARLMLRNKVKRLPVLDDDGRLVGIVSRADVLKAFARSDAEIKEDVRTLLAREVVTVDPAAIAVTVDDGIVVLAGIVEKESDARALLETVLDIDGVVGIENDLAVHIDAAPADPDSSGYLTDGPQHWAQR